MFKESICFISMLFGHHSCPNENAIPVQSTSGNGVIIVNVHAGNERGKTHITGSVEKAMNAGSVNSSRVHLDITATQKGKVLRSLATTFFPTEIPATRRGTPGRSKFDVTISELPSNAEITVTVHRQPIGLCKQKSASSDAKTSI